MARTASEYRSPEASPIKSNTLYLPFDIPEVQDGTSTLTLHVERVVTGCLGSPVSPSEKEILFSKRTCSVLNP